MDTRDILKQIIGEVEGRTGCPVDVTRDPSLKLMAKVDIARGPLRLHRIAINPAFAAEADYLAAFQCGFILRKFEVPAEERVDFAESRKGRYEAEKLIKARCKGQSFPPSMIDGLARQLFEGLIRQLVSMPVGLRVDAWIASAYPGLSGQQRGMADRQLRENVASLKPEVRKFAPERIVNASIAMNAAFANFWARLTGDDKLTLPYRSAGHGPAGSQLLRIFDETPSDPAHDRSLIDAWGKSLDIDGWFEWTPYRLD